MAKKNSKKANINSESVDVYDDELMVSLGIHQPNVTPRDKDVWTKTAKEKKMLKSLRRGFKSKDTHFHSIPQKKIPVYARLVIRLKKNKKFPNTTYSTMCWQHDISNIISKYLTFNTKVGTYDSLISSYNYNGKNYNPSELPFWYS